MELYTDRTQADVDKLRALEAKLAQEGPSGLSPQERQLWFRGEGSEVRTADGEAVVFSDGQLKLAPVYVRGAYNYTDLNRVERAMGELEEQFRALGYEVRLERLQIPYLELPEGYSRLEYLQSTGTQHIDTGFCPKQSTRVICDFQFTASGGAQFLLCARASGAQAYRDSFSLLMSNGRFRSDFGTSKASFGGELAATGRHTLDKNGADCRIDASLVKNPPEAFQSTCSLFLFADNSGGAETNYWGQAKLFSCQIYEGGVLARDFVPCREPGGECGLFDLAAGRFYGNAGTGAFSAGADLGNPVRMRDAWTMDDIWRQADMDRYLRNLNRLRDVLELYPATPPVPAAMAGLTWKEANDIEQILLDAAALLPNAAHTFRHSGAAVSGMGGLIR